ncbi:MAG: universal stress protein [Thermoflexia bacterium]|nr:MAG: universal stress protein [Thermoflexia bacterium]
MELFLCTNGHPSTQPALEYGTWLAPRLGLPATVLGIVEKPAHRPAVQALVEKYGVRLQGCGCFHRGLVEAGKLRPLLLRQAGSEDLVLLGPMAPSFLWGGALARLLAQAEFPVLHTTVYRERLENFLLCTGGLHYVEALVNWLGWLARRVEGNVTLLHVVEPISLTYPLAEEVRAHWQELPQTDTPLGRHLQEAQRALEALGIPVRVRIRHGPVVQEILEEIADGDYDLVGVGSPYAARSLRRLYRPNVALEVAEAAHCPVLIVRYRPGQPPVR